MTPAIIAAYGVIATGTGGICWHHMRDQLNSRDLDVRVSAYITIGAGAVLWPLFWAMAGVWFVRAFRR